METMLKVGAVAVLGALCAVMVKGTARQLALVLSIAAVPITLYNFWESNAAANIRQSQHQCQSRLPASILNVQFYFLYAM